MHGRVYEISWLYFKVRESALHWPLLLSAGWNVLMQAGVHAAILIPAAKAHFWVEQWKTGKA